MLRTKTPRFYRATIDKAIDQSPGYPQSKAAGVAFVTRSRPSTSERLTPARSELVTCFLVFDDNGTGTEIEKTIVK